MARTLLHMSASNAEQGSPNGQANAKIAEHGTRLLKNAKSSVWPRKAVVGHRITFEQLQIDSQAAPPPRMQSGIMEFDRVSGGGLVPGSATLVGGDPGIGKSTLLLQLTCKLAGLNLKAAYISGEESADQVRMRAQRLGLANAAVELGTATNASDIVASMDGPNKPDVMVIDSIQTMFLPNLNRLLERYHKFAPPLKN